MTDTRSRLDDILQKKSASNGFSTLVRKLSGSRSRSRSGSKTQPIALDSDNPYLREGAASGSQQTSSRTSDKINIQPPAGVLESVHSTVSDQVIINSTAPGRDDLEASYSAHSLITGSIKLRETMESLTAFFDTGAACSFISAFQARVNFDRSEIKKIPSNINFSTGGGPVSVTEYVVADAFLPCTFNGKHALAKAPAVFFINSLPNGIDFLLGADFLKAQRISLLLPNMTGIIGCCGNATLTLSSRRLNDFPLSQKPSSGPKNAPTPQLYPMTLTGDKIITLGRDCITSNSDKLIPIDEAQRDRKVPAMVEKLCQDQPQFRPDQGKDLKSKPTPAWKRIFKSSKGRAPVLPVSAQPVDSNPVMHRLLFNDQSMPEIILTAPTPPSSRAPTPPIPAIPVVSAVSAVPPIAASKSHISEPSIVANRASVRDAQAFQSPRLAPLEPLHPLKSHPMPTSDPSPTKLLAVRRGAVVRRSNTNGVSTNSLIMANRTRDNSIPSSSFSNVDKSSTPNARLTEKTIDPFAANLDPTLAAKIGCEEAMPPKMI